MNLSDGANWAQILSLPLSLLLWLVPREKVGKTFKQSRKALLAFALFAAVMGLYRLGWLNWLSPILLWFVMKVRFPVWGLFLVYLAGFASPVFLWVGVRMISKSKTQQPLHWRQYRSDTIFRVFWRWEYPVSERRLEVFCPLAHCKCRLDMVEDWDRLGCRREAPASLYCSHCGLKEDYDCSPKELLRRVVLEVERRCNTGEYAKMQEGQS
jgi:hypothetical protein